MISTDRYFGRQYSRTHYNCAHFASDVWRDATGEDIGPHLIGCFAGRGETTVSLAMARAFKVLAAPTKLCMVLFQGRRTPPHIGVMWRGKVLHLVPRGVEYQPLEVAGMGFNRVRFITC